MSRQSAINEKCKDCIYDPLCGGGTWRQQVEACDIKTCALWPYRPKSRPKLRVDSKPDGNAVSHALTEST